MKTRSANRSLLVVGSVAMDDIDALYFALRSGSIIVYTNLDSPVRQEAPFLTIPSPVTVNGENGLLGLAFHPEETGVGPFGIARCDGETELAQRGRLLLAAGQQRHRTVHCR